MSHSGSTSERRPAARRTAKLDGRAGLALLLSLVAVGCNEESPTEVVDNPVPILLSVTPSSVDAGGPAFDLTVTGAEFVASSVVRWNGSARPTTFSSAGLLTARISAADIATPTPAPPADPDPVLVTVFTPGPGGGVSEALTIEILDLGGAAQPSQP